MTSAVTQQAKPNPLERFWHEAFFYAGLDDFLAGTSKFISDGIAADEAVLVVVDQHKIRMLRNALHGGSDHVTFLDMGLVGRNPARIIPAWQAFVDAQAGGGRGFRGIGEPVWATRSADELSECQLHESLLNVAFDDGPAWPLMCPYDVDALGDEVLDEAQRTHPKLFQRGVRLDSKRFGGSGTTSLDTPLPEAPGSTEEVSFAAGDLYTLRSVARGHAAAAGLTKLRTDEFLLAVHEVATNSVRYGGGHGVMRLWHDDAGALVCEVRDAGRIDRPLVGRERPTAEQEGGRGLWLVNQLCDLVQVRSGPTGTVVRMFVAP